jgi:hypothetical protein
MIFRWNNAWQAGLKVHERQQVLLHEQGHVGIAKASDDLKNQAMEEIRDFSRGYPCPEPLPEGTTSLSFPDPFNGWKVFEDFVINEVKP